MVRSLGRAATAIIVHCFRALKWLLGLADLPNPGTTLPGVPP